jgi:hypothetical protein
MAELMASRGSDGFAHDGVWGGDVHNI